MSSASAALPAIDQADASQSLVYLYCIVEAGTEAQRLLEERHVPGMDPDEPLFPIAAAGLVAAVSRVSAAQFAEEPLNALAADLEQLAPLAVRHEETVRALLPAASSVIPMTFGTIYAGPERVTGLLNQGAEDFRRMLAHVRNRREWGVKVFADRDRLLEAAERGSAEVRRLEEETNRASPGKAYLLGKRRERLVNEQAGLIARQALQTIAGQLGAASADSRFEEIAATEEQSIQLVLKAAYLVDDEATERFQTLAAELSATYAPLGLQSDLTGPWAPYSFVTPDAIEPGANSGEVGVNDQH